MKKTKNKIVIAILAIILIAGIIMVAIKGFNKELSYQETKRLEANIGKTFEIKDIKDIVKEEIGQKNVMIQKVEIYEDAVSITAKDITEEQKNNIISKINEKYGTELKAEEISIINVPQVHLKDMIKQYESPIIIATICILIYLMIRYYKLNSLKVLLKTIAIIVISQIELLSIIALTRIPVGKTTMPILLTVYMLSIYYCIKGYEKQLEIKNQVKCVIYMHLSTVALGTVLAEMTAINRFSQFLNERYIDIDSLEEVDRKVCEDYLVYINTEAIGRKSYSKDLSHLRSIFVTAGKVLENEKLENLFFRDDLGKVPAKLYKVYSHAELKRLNAAIVEGDEQIARALILHQLLGTRISETLSLEQDAIREGREGRFFIRIKQIKTRKTFEKPINEDIRQLFEKSCEYTQAKYGNRKYVFVNDTNPDQAMQYSRIQYQLMVMIQKQNLRDDSGELIGVGTHIWRHCYGKRLTEMHVDDVTIAKLLGHANTSNLKHYRKVGDALLANETRQMRNFMDEILTDVIHEWEGDRNIIK